MNPRPANRKAVRRLAPADQHCMINVRRMARAMSWAAVTGAMVMAGVTFVMWRESGRIPPLALAGVLAFAAAYFSLADSLGSWSGKPASQGGRKQ